MLVTANWVQPGRSPFTVCLLNTLLPHILTGDVFCFSESHSCLLNSKQVKQVSVNQRMLCKPVPSFIYSGWRLCPSSGKVTISMVPLPGAELMCTSPE